MFHFQPQTSQTHEAQLIDPEKNTKEYSMDISQYWQKKKILA